MEHIAAILLLVGCSADLKDCRELPVPTALYETDECANDVAPALRSAAGLYPRLFATCVMLDPALEEENAEIVWDIGRDGKLHASVEPASTLIAADSNRNEPAAPAQF